MSFLNPGMLWAFLAVIPLVAVYLLKIRPVRRQTTTLFLWDHLFQESKSSALLRRLRDLLSLLLMLVAFSATVLATAAPVFTSTDDRDLILLIDNSASMSAADGGETRLDQARKVAKDIITSMSAHRQAAVASVATEVHYLVNLTNNHRALVRGVSEAKPSDLPFSHEAVESLNSSQLADKYRIILISDACFDRSRNLGKVELLKVGEPLTNVGIVAFDMLPLPGELPRTGLYFQLASSYKEQTQLDVLLCHGSAGNVVKVCPVTVTPGANKPEVFTVDHVGTGQWILRLDMPDALDKDNTAYAVLPERKPIKVAVDAAKNGFFFRRCVQAFGSGGGTMVLDDKDAELMLSSGLSKATDAPLANIIFNPTGKSPFWRELGDRIDPGAVNVLVDDHPATRFIDLEAITFAGQRRIKPPANALVLAASDNGNPLIYKVFDGRKSAYVVNMDPDQSELFLSAYFPIMVYSMAVDLTGKTPRRRVSFAPGSPLPKLDGPPDAVYRLTTPDGRVMNRREGAGKMDRFGFYRMTLGDEEKALACSPSDEHEPMLDNAEVASAADDVSRSMPPSTMLIGLAILLVVCESMLYHRRRIG